MKQNEEDFVLLMSMFFVKKKKMKLFYLFLWQS